MISPNLWLLAAGWGSVVAALLHVACTIGGPEWFRCFGAGNGFALAVERGHLAPYAVTVGIAAVLLVWAAYAFAATGAIGPPPLLRTGLIAISSVCLARACAVFLPSLWLPEHSEAFRIVSSLIVGALGAAFVMGTIQAWPTLNARF